MLRVIVAAVLMLSMAVVLTAQNEELSREELRQRRAQLNAQAEQIKQETGFEGTIAVRPEINRITRFRGNFEDIRVPAIEDTVGFRQVFEEILDRILPYFPVDRADLAKETMRVSDSRVFIRYRQTANGYNIEGNSSIGLIYYLDRDLFVINNGLAYLDPAELPTEPVITEEEAIRIFEENVDIPEDFPIPIKVLRLRYSYVRDNGGFPLSGQLEYRLSWILTNMYRDLIIDSISGEVLAIYRAF